MLAEAAFLHKGFSHVVWKDTANETKTFVRCGRENIHTFKTISLKLIPDYKQANERDKATLKEQNKVYFKTELISKREQMENDSLQKDSVW